MQTALLHRSRIAAARSSLFRRLPRRMTVLDKVSLPGLRPADDFKWPAPPDHPSLSLSLPLSASLSSSPSICLQARPLFKDRRKFPAMADPLLRGRYPVRGLYQALAVAAMCLQENAAQRPMIHDVVTALSYLASQTFDPNAIPSR